ncbi:MAG: bifunctional diaminohydroxyphosphoribosylaminopyrimidine deaminase/5-amino-6-(5-phosphoribosylamino)uracil reductase RibD [Bacteroidota bacterium]
MTDEQYMQRCLELAEMGMDSVSPNPMVGCVVVNEGTIIGEGFHARFGEAHAEVNAINDVISNYGADAEELLAGATVFVNLEPCAHFGKTPPCADLLVRHRVKKVVIGNTDPFSDVNGKGIEKLQQAGIEVVTGVNEAQCASLNRRFFTRILKQRPYILLKWAETANGYFAPKDAIQRWISGSIAKKLVHKWRTEEDAILVGKRTALADNPILNVREWPGRNPLRILIDQKLHVPTTSNIFDGGAKTVVFNEVKTVVSGNIHYIQMEDMQYYLPQKIAFQLYLMDIQSFIIEGGANLLKQFIEASLWDEARVFTSNISWDEGLEAPKIHGKLVKDLFVNNDRLSIFENHI